MDRRSPPPGAHRSVVHVGSWMTIDALPLAPDTGRVSEPPAALLTLVARLALKLSDRTSPGN